MQIILEENAARSLGLRNHGPEAACSNAADGPSSNPDRFQDLHPGQRIMVELPLAASGPGADRDDSPGQAGLRSPEVSRFSATVIDVEAPLAKSAAQQCAVFLVPQVGLQITLEKEMRRGLFLVWENHHRKKNTKITINNLCLETTHCVLEFNRMFYPNSPQLTMTPFLSGQPVAVPRCDCREVQQ